MMHSSRTQSDSRSRNSVEYRDVFVRRVHRLIDLGYQRLNPSNYAKAQEPAITGDLVQAIDAVLSDRGEEWMLAYSVHDDPAVNDGIRKGKKRKRVDLRIDSAFVRPRARFRFEAKRLSKKHAISVYLGSEGLGCFLCGDYSRDENHAGMLGYVQSGTLQKWGDDIAASFAGPAAQDHIDRTHPFGPLKVPTSTSIQRYRSKHTRPTVGRPILIDHLLMTFN